MSAKSTAGAQAADRTRLFLGILGGTFLVILVVVFALSIGSGGESERTTYPNAVVQGAALAPFDGDLFGQGDTAIGSPAPIIEGKDLDGNPVEIKPNGEPTIVVLLAHWCPHCQAEVPRIVDWLEGFEAGTEPRVVGIATGIDRIRPNYPPEAWLEREGWPAEVMYDGAEVAPSAFGSTGYPFFAVLDGEGKVVRRMSGEIDISTLDTILAEIKAS